MAAAFFMPGRPLAEPPACDYEQFIEQRIPSATRMKFLFPDDIQARTRYRETLTELELLDLYIWAVDRVQICHEGSTRRFYNGLVAELDEDMDELRAEFEEIRSAAPQYTLGAWKFRNINQDGSTGNLEMMLRCGNDAFKGFLNVVMREALAKYPQLFPAGYLEDIRSEESSDGKRTTALSGI